MASYPSAKDIDLFIYGLNEEQAKQKLEEIYFAICETTMPRKKDMPIDYLLLPELLKKKSDNEVFTEVPSNEL